MTYEDARRKARGLFGENAEVKRFYSKGTVPVYAVGVIVHGKFACLGAGDSWGSAFAGVREKI